MCSVRSPGEPRQLEIDLRFPEEEGKAGSQPDEPDVEASSSSLEDQTEAPWGPAGTSASESGTSSPRLSSSGPKGNAAERANDVVAGLVAVHERQKKRGHGPVGEP
jgi:hypothetical protein